MSRGVINIVKQRLSHPLSRIKLIDQWAVDPDPFLTLTTSAKIGKTAIRLSLHPTVVLNAFLWNEGSAGDASGGNSTWLGNKMRVIGAAGMSGRRLWPLVNVGGGGGGQMMLVAGREKVHFHGMPDQINPCLASEIGQSQFRIGRDEENSTILEG